MASPEAHRMKFMIEFCNHPPFEVITEKDWESCVAYWTRCMAHPSYLRIEDKAVFKAHGFHYFMVQNGHDLEQCRARLDSLRAAARARGVGDLLIGCGVSAHEAVASGHPAAGIFDFTGTYMDLPPLPQREEAYPYSELTSFIVEGRMLHLNDAIPHMPFVAAGWSPRPWPDPRAYFTFPTRVEWLDALRTVKTSLATHKQLGLPGAKAFTIYAWNEFGEGGFVAPTQGEGYLKLEGIREVFAR